MDKTKKFFGCCDLRRGSIVFAWLQMMMVVIVIGILSGFLDFSQSMSNRKDKNGDNDNTDSLYWTMILKIEIATYVIKGATVIALTWGLAKRKYLFYQPWLFISIIELGAQVLLVTFYLVAIFFNTGILARFFGCGFGTAFNAYIFYCIYTVYKKDKHNNPTSVKFDEEYDAVPPRELSYIIKK